MKRQGSPAKSLQRKVFHGLWAKALCGKEAFLLT
jgi:hypothetical protein